MLHVRRRRNPEKHKKKIVICTGSDQTAMESIVTAQQGLRSVHDMMKQTNITLLKLWSILISEAPRVYSIASILFHVWFCVFNLFFCVCVCVCMQHTNIVMVGMSCGAVVLVVIPFKYILMAVVVYGGVSTLKIGKPRPNEQGNRRLKEWWDAIPVIPVEIVDNESANTFQKVD